MFRLYSFDRFAVVGGGGSLLRWGVPPRGRLGVRGVLPSREQQTSESDLKLVRLELFKADIYSVVNIFIDPSIELGYYKCYRIIVMNLGMIFH